MMFLEPERSYSSSSSVSSSESWRDSMQSEYEPQVSGSAHPIVVGIILLIVLAALRMYTPVYYDVSDRGLRGIQPDKRVDESDHNPFGLSLDEADLMEDASRQLNASVRWRQTHSRLHTCSVYVDLRVSPLLVRFLVLAPTSQLAPSYHVNGSGYAYYTCLFLKRGAKPSRGTYLAETHRRHPDQVHSLLYRNSSAMSEVCASSAAPRNCTQSWSREVVATAGTSCVAGGLSCGRHEPVLVNCVVPEEASARIVSLVYRREETAYWFVPGHLHRVVKKRRGSLGVCLPPWPEDSDALRDLVEFVAYYTELGALHFHVYVNVTDPLTVELLRALKSRSAASITYRSWPGVAPDNSLAFAEAALVMDCVYSYSNTPIDYVITAGLREFVVLRKASSFRQLLSKAASANLTSLTLLSQPYHAVGALNRSDMALAQQDKLQVRTHVDPPGRTSRVLLKATYIVEADAACAYQAIQAKQVTLDSDDVTVLRYAKSPDDLNTTGGAYTDFADYATEGSSLAKWRSRLSTSPPHPLHLFWLQRKGQLAPKPSPPTT
ncbi:uncharacterized protein LOC144110894 [Amblyomma americanum]